MYDNHTSKHQDYTTQGYEKLAKRGLSSCFDEFEIEIHREYDSILAVYPVVNFEGVTVGYRKKRLTGFTYTDRNGKQRKSPKYSWLGSPKRSEEYRGTRWSGKPNFDYFHANHLSLKKVIAEADDVLWFVNGEPALMSMIAGGVPNVLTTTLSENSIPDDFIEVLQRLNVTELRYISDSDEAGKQSAGKYRNALDGTGIRFVPLELPEALGEKSDTNDLWIHCGFDQSRFMSAVADLREFVPPVTKNRKKGAFKPKSTHISYSDDLINDLVEYLGVNPERANDKGFVSCKCPFHEDRSSSGGLNVETGVFHCFVCGSFKPKSVAEKLGFDINRYREINYDRPQKKVDLSTAPGSEKPKQSSATKPKSTSVKTASKTVKKSLRSELEPYKLPTVNIPEKMDQIAFHAQYCSNGIDIADLEHYQLIAIKSRLGTGKTEIARLLSEGKRVLVITHRVSLASQASSRFDSVNYEQLQNLYGIDRLTIVSNSLTLSKMSNDGKFYDYDVVFIDEIPHQIKHLAGATFRGSEGIHVLKLMESYMQRAKQVIIASADINTVSIRWAYEVCKRSNPDLKSVYLHNQYQPNRGTLTLHRNKEVALEKSLDEARERNLPLFVAHSSKKEAEATAKYLEQFCKPEHILLITQDTRAIAKVSAFLANPADGMNQYKAVIYTSVADCGLDINRNSQGKPIDAVVCGIFSKEPHDAPTCHQLIGRVRNPIVTHVWVQRTNGTRVTNAQTLFDAHEKRAIKTCEHLEIENHELAITPDQRRLLKLATVCEAEENRSKNDLFSSFYAYAIHEGYTISFHEEMNEVLQQQIQTIKDEHETEYNERLLVTDPVDHEQFEHLTRNKLLSEDGTEVIGHHRFVLEEATGQEISSQIIEDFKDQSSFAKLRLARAFLSDSEGNRQRDLDDIEYGTALHLRSHDSLKSDLIHEFIDAVFSDSYFDENEYTNDEITPRLKTFLDTGNNIERMETILGWRPERHKSAVAVVRWVLGLMNLKLISERKRIGDGKRTYYYSIDHEQKSRWFGYVYGQEVRKQAQNADGMGCPKFASNKIESILLHSGNFGPGDIPSETEMLVFEGV